MSGPRPEGAVGYRVECLSGLPEMQALRPEWADLWRRAPDATPFVSPAWIVAWWRCFGGEGLRLLAVRQQARLVGVVPLFLYRDRGRRRLLPVGIGISDYFDGLFDPPHAAPAAGAAIAWAAGQAGGFDGFELHELPPGAALLACPAPGFAALVEEQGACPTLTLPDRPEDLAACLPAGIRRKIAYYRRRLARMPEARIETAPADAVGPLLEALFRLHGARWATRGRPGVLADPPVQAFHREAAVGLAELGALRLHAVRIAGEVAGVLYCIADARRTHAYLSGIDPRYAQPGLGVLLVAHAIEEAVREGSREFHFLRGREAHKYRWGAVDRINRCRVLTPAGRASG